MCNSYSLSKLLSKESSFCGKGHLLVVGWVQPCFRERSDLVVDNLPSSPCAVEEYCRLSDWSKDCCSCGSSVDQISPKMFPGTCWKVQIDELLPFFKDWSHDDMVSKHELICDCSTSCIIWEVHHKGPYHRDTLSICLYHKVFLIICKSDVLLDEVCKELGSPII